MADVIPLKVIRTLGDTTGLGEFNVGDTVPVDQGGTGATTPAQARANLGIIDPTGETDPIFTASPAGGISAGNINNWNTAFSWGDHANANYVNVNGNQTVNDEKTFDTLKVATEIYFDLAKEFTPGNGFRWEADVDLNPGTGTGYMTFDGEAIRFNSPRNAFGDSFEMGWVDVPDGATPQAFAIGRDGIAGFMYLMPRAAYPQMIVGNDTETGAWFLDGNGNKDIIIQALDTGPNRDKKVIFGEGGIALYDFVGSQIMRIRAPNSLPAEWTLTVPETAGEQGQILETDGAGVTSWVNNPAIPEVAAKVNGFVDGYTANVTITFNDVTRTCEITPVAADYDIYHQGKKITITTAKSVVWSDTSGLKFFYFDSNGDLQHTDTPSAELFIVQECAVAICYWNATTQQLVTSAPELHGIIMDVETHLYNHVTTGARYGFGFGIDNIIDNGNGDVDAHAQFKVEAGEIWDEDIKLPSPDLIVGDDWTIFYRTGATGEWNAVKNHPFPVYNGALPSADRAYYNEWTGSTWQLTEVPLDGDFVLMHIFATNDPDQPLVSIMGQNQYTSVGAARAAAPTEIFQMELDGLPTPEYKSLYSIIFQTNDGAYTNQVHSRIRPDDNGNAFQDWRLKDTGIRSS